jgi:hypothetical protein
VEAAVLSEVSFLFTTAIGFQGNRRSGSFFPRRNPRLHHLEL